MTAPSQATSGVPLLLLAPQVRVLCVGGGTVATAKLRGLLDGGAAIRVVAPELSEQLRAAVDAGRVEWTPRGFAADDLGDAHVVIAGTADPAVNQQVAAAADAAGRLCVRVDRGGDGTAAMMGVVDRDPLVLGVATTAGAPALTALIRQELAERYGTEHGVLAAICAQLRSDPTVRAALAEVDVDARRARWRAVYTPDILGLIRAGHLHQAKEAAFACLSSSSD